MFCLRSFADLITDYFQRSLSCLNHRLAGALGLQHCTRILARIVTTCGAYEQDTSQQQAGFFIDEVKELPYGILRSCHQMTSSARKGTSDRPWTQQASGSIGWHRSQGGRGERTGYCGG